MQYVALIRGINVGGNTSVKMADLKKALEKLGLKDVKTILASGNVIFESSGSQTTVQVLVSKVLKDLTGRDVFVLIRTIAALEKIAATDPFKGIRVTPKTRLYVTFMSDKPKTKKIASDHPGYKILKVTDTEMYSHLEIQDGVQTPDLMKVIDASIGKNITMRNWNTVEKILKAA